MAMNDEETVALIAGGHTFGKTHGAASDDNLEDNPEAAGLEAQGLGWKNNHGTGRGDDTITSGLEVTWTYHPTRWDNEFFHILYAYEWELMKSPPVRTSGGRRAARAPTWFRSRTATASASRACSPAISPCAWTRSTTRSRGVQGRPDAFADAFARAWFKLTHRDMGPVTRYLGPEVPAEELLWQDPVPAPTGTGLDGRSPT
jgi:catalase-peroxidase